MNTTYIYTIDELINAFAKREQSARARDATARFEPAFELAIKTASGTQDVLVCFPFLDGQFLDREEDAKEEGDFTWLFVDLAGKVDTTAAQELFLNQSRAVIEYEIK